MKNYFLLILGLFFSVSFAQRHEIGVFLGGANVIGDIGRTNYINPMPVSYDSESLMDRVPFAVGGLYRFNFNPYMGVRANLMFSKVVGSDYVAPEQYKKNRGYSYKNNITEASLLFEYNFFDINDEKGKKHSPYIFAGIGVFMYNENRYTVNNTFARDANGVILQPNAIATEIVSKSEKETGMTTPFGFGYKYKYRGNFVISAEVGFRHTKTDNLDLSFAKETDFTFNDEPGLNPDDLIELNSNIIRSRQVGNTSNYDWYVFTGLTLTYTFGRPPCYCD
ncbi:MAG TPA: DUF6089 family protein [Moheibacter sp.]|nr:DUF6089 family protein [Moheibacter sp.]